MMKEVRLPGNFTVNALSKADAKVIYHEIYEMQAYNKHGITIGDGDVLLDVGANIGLFSINIARPHKGLQIYLFEPLPMIYECLEKNSALYAGANTFHLNNTGLSDKPGNVTFEFCPAMSMTTGMYGSELSKHYVKDASIFSWLTAVLADIQRAKIGNSALNRFFIKALTIPVIKVLAAVCLSVPLTVLLLWLRFSVKKVNCTLDTLSSVFRKNKITAADLVKIDVEGAEMDVLNGIDADDWKKIRQFIIEVHDVDNRVQKMTGLLEQQNYKVTCDREDWSLHRLMNIYTIYAIKN